MPLLIRGRTWLDCVEHELCICLCSADGLNFKKHCGGTESLGPFEGLVLARLATIYNNRLASSEIVTENTYIAEHIPTDFI
jgi:hypothetical protein